MKSFLEKTGLDSCLPLIQKYIDKVICFVAPKIVLGRNGIFPFGGTGFDSIKEAYILDNITAEQIDNDIMITGYVHYDTN